MYFGPRVYGFYRFQTHADIISTHCWCFTWSGVVYADCTEPQGSFERISDPASSFIGWNPKFIANTNIVNSPLVHPVSGADLWLWLYRAPVSNRTRLTRARPAPGPLCEEDLEPCRVSTWTPQHLPKCSLAGSRATGRRKSTVKTNGSKISSFIYTHTIRYSTMLVEINTSNWSLKWVEQKIVVVRKIMLWCFLLLSNTHRHTMKVLWVKGYELIIKKQYFLIHILHGESSLNGKWNVFNYKNPSLVVLSVFLLDLPHSGWLRLYSSIMWINILLSVETSQCTDSCWGQIDPLEDSETIITSDRYSWEEWTASSSPRSLTCGFIKNAWRAPVLVGVGETAEPQGLGSAAEKYKPDWQAVEVTKLLFQLVSCCATVGKVTCWAGISKDGDGERWKVRRRGKEAREKEKSLKLALSAALQS